MRIQKLLLLLLLTGWLIHSVEAQELVNYDWQDNRKTEKLTSEEAALPAIELFNLQSFEYTFDPKINNLRLYSVVHKIVKVNTDNALESYNRIYVPMISVNKLIKLKARTITPSGKVVEVDENNIKELKDEEGGRGFKIFAIEGAEKGSEIEYFYVQEKHLNFFGRVMFQSETPCKKAYFSITSPKVLLFEAKNYNGFAKATEKEEGETRIVEASMENIPALKKQAFAYYDANRMRMEFKLCYNTNRGKQRILTWNDAAQTINERLFTFDKKETKEAEKLFKQLKISDKLSTEEKIRKIENHLKTNILIEKGNTPVLENIASIIPNGYANEQGVTKLYIALFNLAKVPYEIVLTSDRTSIRFDGNFDSWNYLESYIFHFPETSKFLSPEDLLYRYPLIPYVHTFNDGLFMKRVSLGDYETLVAQVKNIPANPYTENFHNMDIHIDLPKAMDKAKLTLRQDYGGYAAAMIQPFYAVIPDDRKKEVVNSLVKFAAEDAEVVETKVTGGEPNTSLTKTPFVIDATLYSSSLIEKAGNKYLFKLGKVIGQQSELYQEEERTMTVENEFNRMYDRKIILSLPEGYIAKNIDDIKIEKVFEKDGDVNCLFRSSYTVKGNQITINIEEYYKEITCSVADFPKFREVINAAADFNKITLVLEKK